MERNQNKNFMNTTLKNYYQERKRIESKKMSNNIVNKLPVFGHSSTSFKTMDYDNIIEKLQVSVPM